MVAIAWIVQRSKHAIFWPELAPPIKLNNPVWVVEPLVEKLV